MDILQGTKQLIEKKLIMLPSQVIISLDDLMEIWLHELKYNINILKFSSWRRKHDVLNFNNVWMPKKPEKLYFTENSISIRNVLKNDTYFLYCNFFSRVSVYCRANNTIASFSYDLLNFIPICITIIREELHLCRALPCIRE